MRKNLFYLLIVALSLPLFMACSDDDDDNNGGGPPPAGESSYKVSKITADEKPNLSVSYDTKGVLLETNGVDQGFDVTSILGGDGKEKAQYRKVYTRANNEIRVDIYLGTNPVMYKILKSFTGDYPALVEFYMANNQLLSTTKLTWSNGRVSKAEIIKAGSETDPVVIDYVYDGNKNLTSFEAKLSDITVLGIANLPEVPGIEDMQFSITATFEYDSQASYIANNLPLELVIAEDMYSAITTSSIKKVEIRVVSPQLPIGDLATVTIGITSDYLDSGRVKEQKVKTNMQSLIGAQQPTTQTLVYEYAAF